MPFRCGGKLLPAGGKRRLCLLKFFFGLFPCLCLSKFPADLFKPFFRLCQPLRRLPLEPLVLPDQPVRQFLHLRHGKPSCSGLLKKGRKRILLLTGEIPDILLYSVIFPRAGIPQLSRLLLQFFLQDLVAARLEQLPEDSLALLGIRQQKLQEVPLGNHGDLGKLVSIHPEDFPDGRVYLPYLRNQAAVGQGKLRVRFLEDYAAAPLRRALILRVPADRVTPVPVCKGQLHKGRRVRSRVF